MKQAIWKGQVLAESNETINVEGNEYFPHSSINKLFFLASKTETVCPWKGTALYYDLLVDDEINKDAAWFYPKTTDKAKEIEGYVAFWKGVEVN